MGYKKIKVYKMEKTNPFIDDLITEVKIKTKNIIAGSSDKLLVVSQDTGQVEGHTQFVKMVKRDTTQFIKFFTSKLTSFFELSKRAQKILSYIMNKTMVGKDYVYFEYSECTDYTGYTSHTTINSALAELIEKKIIARSLSNFKYFINPTIFFNGDRVSFIESVKIDRSINIEHSDRRNLPKGKDFELE